MQPLIPAWLLDIDSYTLLILLVILSVVPQE